MRHFPRTMIDADTDSNLEHFSLFLASNVSWKKFEEKWTFCCTTFPFFRRKPSHEINYSANSFSQLLGCGEAWKKVGALGGWAEEKVMQWKQFNLSFTLLNLFACLCKGNHCAWLQFTMLESIKSFFSPHSVRIRLNLRVIWKFGERNSQIVIRHLRSRRILSSVSIQSSSSTSKINLVLKFHL